MNKQLLIFDLDGTLIDSRSDLATAVNLMRADYGLAPLSAKTISSYIGDGAHKLVERSLRGIKIDLESALTRTLGYYAEHLLDQTRFYADVETGLKKLLACGHTLAILSNKPGTLSRQIIRELEAADFFYQIIGGGDLKNLKPAPDGIYRLLQQSGISASESWMIGDHHTDLETAHNAGIKSGFVSYGIGHPDKFSATQTWPSFAELVKYFCLSSL
ncbi:MAG: HAD-IIIA family hydrolase [Deltaproteobacteria bacterium]|nr:HAD-IIIA family hydrolase [Deltaproteobacteria bacterium]